MSESFNAALRQLDEAGARKPATAREFSRSAESIRVLSSEWSKQARILKWLAWSALAGTGIYLAAVLAKRFL